MLTRREESLDDILVWSKRVRSTIRQSVYSGTGLAEENNHFSEKQTGSCGNCLSVKGTVKRPPGYIRPNQVTDLTDRKGNRVELLFLNQNAAATTGTGTGFLDRIGRPTAMCRCT
jgi:hypothetical protein